MEISEKYQFILLLLFLAVIVISSACVLFGYITKHTLAPRDNNKEIRTFLESLPYVNSIDGNLCETRVVELVERYKRESEKINHALDVKEFSKEQLEWITTIMFIGSLHPHGIKAVIENTDIDFEVMEHLSKPIALGLRSFVARYYDARTNCFIFE